MILYPPRGMRYDTSVPERCTASDLELQFSGPDACPEGSRLGGGTTEGIFQFPVANDLVLDRYTHTVDVMNNENEQIVLVKAEGYAVVRGRSRPDGARVQPTDLLPDRRARSVCRRLNPRADVP